MWVVLVGKLCVGACLLGLATIGDHIYESRLGFGFRLSHYLELGAVTLLALAAAIALVTPWT